MRFKAAAGWTMWLHAALFLPGCATQAAPPPPPAPAEVAVQNDVAYGPLPAERGDLFLPAPAGPRRRAAVLVIHGGGWVGGSRATNTWLSGLIAARGYVVFNIDYRLGSAAVPDTHWPAQLVDAQLAVRWLRANARQFQLDPARIAAVGDSAGGTLAVLLGVLDQPVAGNEAGLLADQRSGVSAVVDSFGITDLAAIGPNAAGMLEGMFGSKTPPPEQVQSVSPLPFVSRRSAPMLIVHGDKDNFVPLDQSQQLLQALKARGVPARLDVFAGGHGFEGVGSDAIAALFKRNIDWLVSVMPP